MMDDRIAAKDLKEGDVLLYRGSAWLSKAIQFFDGSPANHVAVYVGNGRVGEAVMEGVVERDIQTSISGYEWVKAFRLADVPDDMGPVLTRAREYLAEGERYAFEQLLMLAFLCTTRKLKITPVLRRLLRTLLDTAAMGLARMLSAGKEPMICSEFAFRVYDEAAPPMEDAYSIEIPGRLPLPGEREVRQDQPRTVAEHRGVHPDSLAALFSTPASSVWFESEPEARELEPMDEALEVENLERLIEAYLHEAQTGETSDRAVEVGLEELRVATDRFAVGLYKAVKPREAGEVEQEAPVRSAAYDNLFRIAADFVTPADLYSTRSLALVGTVEL
jgi:hypothetical protein